MIQSLPKLTIPLLCALASAAAAQGPGDLTVTPTRAVFENRTRSVQLALIHRGTAPATYRLSFIQMRMNDDGRLAEITAPEPEERFADSLIRYAPRQVTLEPGVAQTVRLLLRKPADLPPGEYRSHLLLRAVPVAGAGNVEALAVDAGGIGIRLTPVYGVSIPVIVRHGDLAAETTVSDLALHVTEAGPEVEFRVRRAGGRSLYGDVKVTYSPAAGEPVVVGQIKGLAVYVPNDGRTVRFVLTLPEGVALDRGRLEVSFSEDRDGAAARAELSLS